MDLDLTSLPAELRASMRAAGAEIRECHRVLKKGGLNVVGEILRGQGDFIELEHYPRDDVFDAETHGQYYYHAHRGIDAEHGHFHLFLRAGGMPAGSAPIDYPQATEAWQREHSGADVFEDRALDITGYLPISPKALMAALDEPDAPAAPGAEGHPAIRCKESAFGYD
jgi:hypothetical protein